MCVECGYHLETGKFAKGLGGAAAGPKAEGHAGAADMLLKKAKYQIEAERAEEKELRKQGMPTWMILSGLLAVGALIALGTLLGGDVALASLIVLLIAVPSAVIGAAIGAILGGLVFQLACFVYNKFAGGESAPAAVPQPEYGGAYKIVFISSAISSVMNFVIGFLIGVIIILALGPEIGQARVNSAVVQVLMNLISIPIALFVMSGVARKALPTTYGRAILVTLLYMVLGVVIGAVIAAPILLILFMLSVIG
jgi:hypothetical protein